MRYHGFASINDGHFDLIEPMMPLGRRDERFPVYGLAGTGRSDRLSQD